MNTLSSVINEVRNWSERSDLTDDQIRSFVGMVEDDFKGEFFLPFNETEVTLTTNANGRIAIPANFLRVKRMTAINSEGNEYVIYRKPNDVVINSQGWEGQDSEVYFERRGGEFFFAPSLGAGRSITLTYYNIIPSLVSGTSNEVTNDVLEVLPAVYLFGALKHVFLFTYNEERAAFYEQLYKKAKEDLIEIQEKAEMAGSRMAVFPSLSE